jgi:hypothetical protein
MSSRSRSQLPLQKEEDIQEKTKDQCKDQQNQDEDINALSGNKVGVEIEPDVNANRVVVQICSCSVVWNCFSYPG